MKRFWHRRSAIFGSLNFSSSKIGIRSRRAIWAITFKCLWRSWPRPLLQRARDDPGYTHEAFSLLRHHLKRRDVARALGYPNFSTFREFLDRSARLFHEIEALHPDVPKNSGGPNVEYPWEARDSRLAQVWQTPAAQEFSILIELQSSGDGTQLIDMIRRLLERFDAVFPI